MLALAFSHAKQQGRKDTNTQMRVHRYALRLY